ncbi:MAG: hypothetical protein ABSA79_10795 [Candidatus Bathyarchaeia archaeon]|jgi:drug/metabolite transporter (DMT)-like permease
MSGTRQLGIALIVFGALLLIGAGFAYTYQETTTQVYYQGLYLNGQQIVPPMSRDITTTPYRDDSTGLVLGAVALFVVGFALLVYKSQNAPAPPEEPQPSFKLT